MVGSGVAGLTAAHVLRKAHDVTLYEADDRVGGHAHTHELGASDGRVHRVDSGFIVHDRRTYPHLLRLFDELGIATQESEMSMSVRCEGCGLEYAGARGPAGLLAQPRSLLRGPYLRMLAEVPRFHRAARALLELPEGPATDMTLGEFARRGRFSPYFHAHFLTPMVSAVWSCDPVTALRYPARYLSRSCPTTACSPSASSRSGGPSPAARTRTSSGSSNSSPPSTRPPRSAPSPATRTASRLKTEDGTTTPYDAVVIATHPDQALRLLADPTDAERTTLGAFTYSRNPTLLHTDTTLLPRSRGARASWNYLMPSCAADADRVTVSYDMNRLQRLDAPETFVVTLNSYDRVDPVPYAPAWSTSTPSTPRSRCPPGPAARALRPCHRLRGGVPRLGLPRGRLPVGAEAAAAALGVTW
ncbi:FAD-dependent oxidoreductase OS=Streptomyces microflavus OX=1919 GN=G3I39_36725 PE=4 SV=1 [Streptomyces microflavus]